MIDKLIVLAQSVLPHHFLSGLMHALTRIQWPPLSQSIIRFLIWRYDIQLEAAQEADPAAYPHVNAFFTRALKPESRPLPRYRDAIASPADGRISAAGRIDDGLILQAKGHRYRVAELLADQTQAAAFNGGSFATIYLSPRDYHRVHMPLDATLISMTHVPGRLYSVAPALVRALPGLFARNERVVTLWQTEHGLMAQILVGAIFVGSIDTVWAGTIVPPRARETRRIDYQQQGQDIRLMRGDEMGRFNMGSTVICLFANPQYKLNPQLIPDFPLKMGEKIGCYIDA